DDLVTGVQTCALPISLESVRALADAAERRFGAVHIVCNNAGVATMSEVVSATHADWQYTMNVNFWGVVHGVETFVPRLLAHGAEIGSASCRERVWVGG